MVRVALRPLLREIRACTECADRLPAGPRPIVQAGTKARVAVIGQAPGRQVQQTGIPWDDPRGDRLRRWLGVERDTFYDSNAFALVPMGFCYPGTSKGSDLTDTVLNWRASTPRMLPMPHPSARNQRWLVRNPWFEEEVVPYMQRRLKRLGLH